MAIESFGGVNPQLNEPSFIAASADIIGRVTLHPGSNVWYNATIRADVAPIEIGEGSNVQDNSCLHVDYEQGCRLGKYVTVGHSVTLHACTVEDACLIGMGAVVLDGAKIGDNCLVGAGSLVTGKMDAPAGSMILGSPAKVVRPLTEAEIEDIRESKREYLELAEKCRNAT